MLGRLLIILISILQICHAQVKCVVGFRGEESVVTLLETGRVIEPPTYVRNNKAVEVKCPNSGGRLGGDWESRCINGRFFPPLAYCAGSSSSNSTRQTQPGCRLKLFPNGNYVDPEHMQVVSEIEYGEWVMARCEPGFVAGPWTGQRQCLTNGTLSGYDPECLNVKCTVPRLDNGFFFIDSGGGGSVIPLLPSSEVSVYRDINVGCYDGYNSGSISSVQCQGNGRFNLDQIECVKDVTCELPKFENGMLSYQSSNGDNQAVPVGTIVEPTCFDGFDMEPANGQTPLCQPNGQFSTGFPTCSRRRSIISKIENTSKLTIDLD